MKMSEYAETALPVFPEIVLSMDGQGPMIIQPVIAASGEPHYSILWTPDENDISIGGGYTDTKVVQCDNKPQVLVARTRKVPHVMFVDRASRKTVWNEKGDVLQEPVGGVHSATFVPQADKGKGTVVVAVPNSGSETPDNMMYINKAEAGQGRPFPFYDCHAAVWIDENDGAGGGYLWAVGRSIPQNATGAANGKCLLNQYRLDDTAGLKLVNTYVLVETPQELSKLNQNGWYECPHDIARPDKDTLWIPTEWQVLSFDLKTRKVGEKPVSKDLFRSVEELPLSSPTNLKCISLNPDYILYTQTMGNDDSTSSFCIVSRRDQTKYVFPTSSPIYKARWA